MLLTTVTSGSMNAAVDLVAIFTWLLRFQHVSAVSGTGFVPEGYSLSKHSGPLVDFF